MCNRRLDQGWSLGALQIELHVPAHCNIKLDASKCNVSAEQPVSGYPCSAVVAISCHELVDLKRQFNGRVLGGWTARNPVAVTLSSVK